MFHYHNTLYARGNVLANYEVQATRQDSRVLEFMAHNPSIGFTAEHIHELVMPKAPLTSARRALSNLCRDGYLVKMAQVDGQYGRPIWVYQIDEDSL